MQTEIQFNPVEFWQLDASLRFPSVSTTWDQKVTVTTPHGSYLGTLVEDTRQRITLLRIPNLSHPEWRLAFYHRPSPRSGLSTVDSVLAGCRPKGWMTDVPAEWIGAESTTDVCTSLAKAVRGFTPAESEGFTVILRLFRAVPLEKHEVLRLNWWDPAWVHAFTENVRIVP